MATLYLIDHSLKNAGGHHFDYACRVLQEAEQAGYQVVLATNRRYRERHLLPTSWQVYSLFRHHMYSKFTVLEGWQGGALGTDGELLDANQEQRAQDRGPTRQRLRRLKRFQQACEQLFLQCPLEKDDRIFVPSLSEFDLLALVRYLEEHPATLEVEWHLQFHFNLFQGRDTDFENQTEIHSDLRRQFESALNRIPDHRLYFYTTTAILARQYNRLRVAHFQPLPYPIGNDFEQLATRRTRRTGPLRLTCAGAVRAEKGQHLVREMTNELWDSAFANGKLQLAAQAKRKRWGIGPRSLPGVPAQPRRFSQPTDSSTAPILLMRHPLDGPQYQDLIGNSDIGLLMYDAERYYSRHAGVLGEYLSAGVPVIVPGGCWLAEQIGPCNQEYLRYVGEDATPLAQETLVLNDSETSAPISAPEDSLDCHLELHWNEVAPVGSYVRLKVEQLSDVGSVCREDEWLLAADTKVTRALCHLHPGTRHIRVQVENAFHASPAMRCRANLSFLTQFGEDGLPEHLPRGSVGLIAASSEQVPLLIREMIQHYPHYRQTANTFARVWHDRHRPLRTWETLDYRARQKFRQAA